MMKTSHYVLTITLSFYCFYAWTQKSHQQDFPEKLPDNLILDSETERSYHVITDYLDYDLKGNFIRKTRVSGKYTNIPGCDSVKWNEVRLAFSGSEKEEFPRGDRKDYMEDFRYIPGPETINASFFSDLPVSDMRVRNLIWDMFMFEYFAYLDWDSLEINTDYPVIDANLSIDLAGQGTFSNSDIRLNWNGITRMNDELCARIHFSAMNNPLSIEMESFSMEGRSHYWGDILVSLVDKEIEHASLSEDVITDVSITGQPQNFLGYTVRYMSVEKIK